MYTYVYVCHSLYLPSSVTIVLWGTFKSVSNLELLKKRRGKVLFSPFTKSMSRFDTHYITAWAKVASSLLEVYTCSTSTKQAGPHIIPATTSRELFWMAKSFWFMLSILANSLVFSSVPNIWNNLASTFFQNWTKKILWEKWLEEIFRPPSPLTDEIFSPCNNGDYISTIRLRCWRGWDMFGSQPKLKMNARHRSSV